MQWEVEENIKVIFFNVDKETAQAFIEIHSKRVGGGNIHECLLGPLRV